MLTRQKLLLIPLTFLYLSALLSCKVADCLQGEGEIVTKEIDLPPFEKVINAGIADIIFTAGPQTIRVGGNENVVDDLLLEVKNKTLNIWHKHRCYNGAHFKVHISAPHLKSISSRGIGNIIVESAVTDGSLLLENTGDGDLDFYELQNIETLDVINKGTGNIVGHSGQVIDKLRVNLSGTGDFIADKYPSRNVEIISKGVGETKVWATISINATIRGTGNIILRGSPEISQDVSGTGEIIRK